MPLALLFATPVLRTSYEATSNLLVLDWHGQLTRSAVQLASVQLGQLVLTHPYERVLVNTQQMRAVGSDVAGWLGQQQLPSLPAAGITHLAWASGVAADCVALAQQGLSGLPAGQARVFTEVTHATCWLRSAPATLPEPLAHEGEAAPHRPLLRRRVALLQWRVLTALARHPLWLLAEPTLPVALKGSKEVA